MSAANEEILREFLLETHENLVLLDADLITLEKNPSEKNTLAQVFRTLHSVKGTAGFMGLVKLQSVAHAAESLLSRLRAGELHFNAPIATGLLQVVDAIREMLACIESSGDEGTGDYSALIAELERLRRMDGADLTLILPAALISNLKDEQTPGVSASSSGNSTSFAETIVPEAPEPRAGSNVADSNIRVDVTLLDKLMTLVGELVLARNQILQYTELHQDDEFVGAVQRLNLLTTDLQASVMKTRMQPIGNVLNKFPRVVRDLALACGKKVRFEVSGQETELDKTLIEAIRDPLTHMVRNAIDHGIETPDIRRLRQKPDEGCLRMEAFHEGGKVLIEITDDGAGIDVARVREKAISQNLVTPELVSRMSHQEILRLVLLPGFSTADQVTQFSGRGVGMDVVRINIERIGGTVDIESTPGKGTTIRTKIPLTLAIIPALIIVSGGERYAIPQVSLLELVRIDPEQSTKRIEWMHGAPVYRLRGNLLPLVFLDEQLQLTAVRDPEQDLSIVVLQADECPFGLVVDAIRDTEEIVVKPLQKQLKRVAVFAGAAIMGDGRVALVLDVLGLAQRAGVTSRELNRSSAVPETPPADTADKGESLLFFEPRGGGHMAIPMSVVARLEKFPVAMLEKLGSRQVVQYRGEILPLVDVSAELEHLRRVGLRIAPEQSNAAWSISNPDTADAADAISVVVCADEDYRAGLVVENILDIVHEEVFARSRSDRPGVLFTAVVQERVTEFIDVAALVRRDY